MTIFHDRHLLIFDSGVARGEREGVRAARVIQEDSKRSMV